MSAHSHISHTDVWWLPFFRSTPRSIHLLGRHTSRRSAVIEVEHPTKPRTAMDHAVIRGNGLNSPDQAVVQPLMIASSVIMGDVFSRRATKRRFSNEDHSIQAFELDRANEPLGIGVQIR